MVVGFSITSNGTLIDEDDGRFFEEHGFAVTISLDGPQPVHDRLRPYNGGRGSFDKVLANASARAGFNVETGEPL